MMPFLRRYIEPDGYWVACSRTIEVELSTSPVAPKA